MMANPTKGSSIIENIVQAVLIAFLVLFPHFAPLPFYSYAIVCLAVIIFYLRTKKETLRNIGLKRNGLTGHALFIGILSALFFICFNQWVFQPFITRFFVVPDYTEYDFIRNNLSTLVLILLAAWIIGGFYEEIVFRGFILILIQHWALNIRHSYWIAGLLSNILFGLYHWQQGIFGMIHAFLGGLLWTYLLWRYKGNLWYAIVSHAVYDTILLILIYNRVPV